MENKTYIVYCTTNLVNGKKYIGSHSCNSDEYLGSGVDIKKSIKKYGKDNFDRQVLAKVKSYQIMRELEEYWCEYFDVENNKLFYNRTNKGVGAIKGDEFPKAWKPIIQYDLKGNFIKEWKSTTIASRTLNINNIGRVLRKTQKSAGGYLWFYKDEPPTIFKDEREKGKSIIQYDKKMNFIKQWKSTWKASKSLKIENANIRNAYLKGHLAGGFYWEFGESKNLSYINNK